LTVSFRLPAAVTDPASVPRSDVAADELAVARGEQKGLAGWAARFRKRQQAKKDAAE